MEAAAFVKPCFLGIFRLLLYFFAAQSNTVCGVFVPWTRHSFAFTEVRGFQVDRTHFQYALLFRRLGDLIRAGLQQFYLRPKWPEPGQKAARANPASSISSL